MTRYDGLNPKTELEQDITADLKNALEKRGFQVRHNGTPKMHAPAKVPDIEAWVNDTHLNIEVTKTKKSDADREMLSVADHLDKTKALFPQENCYALYVSPETHYRMINGIHNYNVAHKDKPDLKILPICFSTVEMLLDRLSGSHKSLYPPSQLIGLFTRYNDYTDDFGILKIIREELFPADLPLKKEIDEKEVLIHAKIEQDLFHDLDKIENRLRESGKATAADAIRNLIYLVFIKLYEEKAAGEGEKNYFTRDNFVEFQKAQRQTTKKQAIHKLFELVRDEEEFQKSGLFSKTDHLADKLDDDFVLEEVIEPLEKYHLYQPKVDGLGAAYEVLALRSSKDVKVGQFFTPKTVVEFMVKLAELESSDSVLDPACGTGRFLIWAMSEMEDKVSGKDAAAKILSIKHEQLRGSDIDPNVAKLAKMNMYIHQDGKANIWDDDGLTLYKTRHIDNSIDVILTNPPLGRLNYRREGYDNTFLERMEVIPRGERTPSLHGGQNVEQEMDDDSEVDVTGNLMKGGALFVNACCFYLKEVRAPNAPLEWRGGKLLTILDEGILNTDDYKETRKFIRDRYYIKAIISLTTDTFKPVSNTPTKTSILYAIRKDDITAKQTEPIFFAHASKVGMDTKRRPCPNHLNDILTEYLAFKRKVQSCYNDNGEFSQRKFDSLSETGGLIGEEEAN